MWLLSNIHIPHSVAVFAVDRLSEADYSVATKVSEGVAQVVHWAAVHEGFWWLTPIAMNTLQTLDGFGSMLISLVVWIVMHST